MSKPDDFDPRDPRDPRGPKIRPALIPHTRPEGDSEAEALLLATGYFIDAETGMWIRGRHHAGERRVTWTLPFEMPQA